MSGQEQPGSSNCLSTANVSAVDTDYFPGNSPLTVVEPSIDVTATNIDRRCQAATELYDQLPRWKYVGIEHFRAAAYLQDPHANQGHFAIAFKAMHYQNRGKNNAGFNGSLYPDHVRADASDIPEIFRSHNDWGERALAQYDKRAVLDFIKGVALRSVLRGTVVNSLFLAGIAIEETMHDN